MNSRKISYSLFVLSFYSDQYNWTQAYLMVVAFYICLYIFVQHLKSEKRSPNGNKSNRINFLHSIVLNVCSLWGGVICFGKTFLPANVYTCSIVLIAVICRECRESAQWVEKLFIILSVFSLSCEYLLLSFQDWIRTSQNEEVRSVIKAFIVALFIFLFIL